MSKQVLDIEQMKHLNELGVNTDEASFCVNVKYPDKQIFTYDTYYSEIEYHLDVQPVFTLQDILDVLPKDITKEGCNWSASLYIDYENNRIAYGNTDRDGFEIYYEVPICENIIDAAYKMFCWCIKQGYIPTDK